MCLSQGHNWPFPKHLKNDENSLYNSSKAFQLQLFPIFVFGPKECYILLHQKTLLSLSMTLNTLFSLKYSKSTVNHKTNDPVTAWATLTLSGKGALYGLIQRFKPQFTGSLSSMSLINGGLWN